MEWSILFAGPVGAGKTQAIRVASDIEVVSTEADASDEVALLKADTTVAMDMGLVRLDGSDKVRLLGAPGQERFDFMWDILLDQACGLVLLADHSRPDPVADLRFYAEQLAARSADRMVPCVVGVTHVDTVGSADLSPYRRLFSQMGLAGHSGPVPVMEVDARARRDVRGLLLTLTSMLDIVARMPLRAPEARAWPS